MGSAMSDPAATLALRAPAAAPTAASKAPKSFLRERDAMAIVHLVVRRFAIVVVAIAACLAAAPLAAKADGAHLLGPEDTVAIKILDWRSGAGEIFDWSPVGGSYTVSADGRLSLPLLGNIEVAGLTLDDASSRIAERMKARIGMAQTLHVSLQIEKYRPFYILGAVESSGAYESRPGLTVLKAVALAGGYAKGDLAAIRAEGQSDQLLLERRRALLRQARLLVELKGGGDLEMPAGVATDSVSLQLLNDERKIMQARRNRLAAKKESIDRLKELALQEVDVLEKKRVLLEGQVETLTAERDRIGDLIDRKLARSAAVVLAETRLTNAQRELLDLTRSSFRARQDVTRLERDLEELESEERADVRLQLQRAEAEIEQLEARIKTERSLAYRSGSPTEISANQEFKPAFEIKRRVGEEIKVIAASEDASVAPGDVIKVLRLQSGVDDVATR